VKCLILGGGGFLGSHLADALLDAGHSVRIFERPNLLHFRVFGPLEPIEWREGDFLNTDDLTGALSGCDVVFHLISTTLPRSSNENPAYDVDTNVVATIRLLEAACRVGVRKIIFASSGGTVYGVPQEIPIKETHPTEPTCSYGICKLATEKYLHLYNVMYGLEYRVLRMANPFGERQRTSTAQGAISVFLQKAIHDEVIEIWGDGSIVRDYFYVHDAVNAFLAAANHEGCHRVFNVGSGIGRSLNDVIASIDSLIGRQVRKRYASGRSFDVPANVLDITRAREHLLWRPSISFDEGLARTLAWMQKDLD
jgi:UDP-glucose 4-epimerase